MKIILVETKPGHFSIELELEPGREPPNEVELAINLSSAATAILNNLSRELRAREPSTLKQKAGSVIKLASPEDVKKLQPPR